MEERAPCIFLPGIIAPAVVRYAALIRELGTGARAYTKELEVYTTSTATREAARSRSRSLHRTRITWSA